MNQKVPIKGRGWGWVLVQVLTMTTCVLTGWFWPGQWSLGPGDRLFAAVLGLIAINLGIAGVWALGHNRTICPEPQPDGVLVQHGIYRWVRHPLYSSVILMAWAWGVWRNSLVGLGAAAGLTLFMALKARNEEARLMRRYPAYEAYRCRTHRFLPWLI